MSYQEELICVRCGSKGTIKKVKLHDMFEYHDEHIYFMCTNCKSYGTLFESLTTNFEEFPLFLDEDWEWGDEKDLLEKKDEEDIIDLTKKGDDLEKEQDKFKKLFGGKRGTEKQIRKLLGK